MKKENKFTVGVAWLALLTSAFSGKCQAALGQSFLAHGRFFTTIRAVSRKQKRGPTLRESMSPSLATGFGFYPPR
jgi:hypothetical protein